jgi:hypothetical protein
MKKLQRRQHIDFLEPRNEDFESIDLKPEKPFQGKSFLESLSFVNFQFNRTVFSFRILMNDRQPWLLEYLLFFFVSFLFLLF